MGRAVSRVLNQPFSGLVAMAIIITLIIAGIAALPESPRTKACNIAVREMMGARTELELQRWAMVVQQMDCRISKRLLNMMEASP